MKEVRWGILGPGSIARTFAEAVKRVPGCSLSAVGSRSFERAADFASKHDVERPHGSYFELVNDPDVDAVYVATPHAFHCEHAILALRAGKAVLCEKPLALNARQAEAMARASREEGLFLMEAMWTRFLPAVRWVGERVRAGDWGEVKFVYADFGFRSSFDPASRLYDLRLGGGALLDVGVYPVSFATMLLGEPETVSSAAELGLSGVDESSSYLLAYAKGAQALLSSSIIVTTPQEARIVCERGWLRLKAPFFRSTSVEVHSGGEVEMHDFAIPGNGFEFQIEEAAARIRAGAGESSMMPHQESVAVLRTLDRIREPWGLKYPGDEASE
ncbi:MAG: Gfo/Idh/MocA family oxidoreductase [Fimbriimonadaceae bacterium]|nr:MAG: putative dehydrogenase [Armatimonadetes bacterium OLB18]WKZ80487.1 MAG: Gfo/Idh/MocA family oxidoreductase [Fimbriimonadaceae bacterium]